MKGVGNVRFCFRASVSIGKRLSTLACLASRAFCSAMSCAVTSPPVGVECLATTASTSCRTVLVFDCSILRICSRAPSLFCLFVFMVFFFLLCIASSVRRPSRKRRAASPPPWKWSSEGRHEWAGWFCGEAVRAMERNAESEKAGPENSCAWLRHANTRLNERSEPINSYRRPGWCVLNILPVQGERLGWREGCRRTGAEIALTLRLVSKQSP